MNEEKKCNPRYLSTHHDEGDCLETKPAQAEGAEGEMFERQSPHHMRATPHAGVIVSLLFAPPGAKYT